MNLAYSETTASQPACVYSLTGSLVVANSNSCSSAGDPTVISDAYGHASPNNGLLLYNEKLYFAMLVGGGFGAKDLPNEMTATNEWKSQTCQYHYDKNGNFVAYWGPYQKQLSDSQKRVLSDMQENYSVFVCPFTGTPTTSSSSSNGLSVPIISGTVNVMNLGNSTKANSETTSNMSTMQYWGNNNSTTRIFFGSSKPSAVIKDESPLKQFKSGIAAKDVKCKEGLQFIMKNENGHPACVTSHTFDELINRGWGILPLAGLPMYHNTSNDVILSYNGTQLSDKTVFYVKQGQNMTLMLDVTSNPENIPVTLYTSPHNGFTKTNGIDFKLSDTMVNTPAKVMLHISVSKDATSSTYGATVKGNTTDSGSVTYLFFVTVK